MWITLLPLRFSLDLAQFIHKLFLHIPNTVQLLCHIQEISVIHMARTVSHFRYLIEIIADTSQVSAHFPQGGIVHIQDIPINRHFSHIGFPVIRGYYPHPFMNHVKLFRGDTHQNPDFPCVLLSHVQIICSFFRAGV